MQHYHFFTKLSSAFLMFFICAAPSFAQDNETTEKKTEISRLTCQIPRKGNEINFNITIKYLYKKDLTEGDLSKTLENTKVWLVNETSSGGVNEKYIPYQNENVDSMDEEDYFSDLYLTLQSNSIATGTEVDGYYETVSYTIGATEQDGGKIGDYFNSSWNKCKISFKDEYEKGPYSIQKITAVPKDTPPTPTITPQYESLLFNWSVPSTIKYNDDNESALPPPGIVLFVINLNIAQTNSLSFKTKIYNADLTKETEGTSCSFNIHSDQTDCSITDCSATEYINHSLYVEKGPEKQTGVEVYELNSTTTGHTIQNASLDHNYAVFLAYQEGLARSECKVGSSILNYTLTELNGGKPPKLDIAKCFIATAAYGSPFHNDIYILREFRDNTLLTNDFGRFLVKLYYSYGPIAAEFIASSDTLKSVTRYAFLTPLVAVVKLYNVGALWILMTISMVIGGTMVFGTYYARYLWQHSPK